MELVKRSFAQIESSMASTYQSAVSSLLKKRGEGSSVSSYTPTDLCLTKSPFLLAASASTDIPSISRVQGSNDPFEIGNYALMSNSSQRTMSSINMDIRKSNNASVEMAIADFFHCANIPDAVVETPEFKRLVRMCRLVDKDFVIPSKKKIGGKLLDINFANINGVGNI
jgi:hypothetical protein